MQKTILVTGASSGLGEALARHFHERGDRVYGTSRTAAQRPWPMLELDVTSDRDVARLRELPIDVAINSAGYAFLGALEETSVAEARAQMEVNFFGAMRVMLAVLPGMRVRGRGHIVNLSSISGAIGMPFTAAYAASKHALEGASESLAHELYGTNIHVTILQPDGMRTGIGARFQQPTDESPALSELRAKRRRLVALLERKTAPDGDGIDPAVLVAAVAEAVASPNPPLRIVIGETTKRLIAAKQAFTFDAFARTLAEAQ